MKELVQKKVACIDFDDTLAPCIKLCCTLFNSEHPTENITPDQITAWAGNGNPYTEKIAPYFNDLRVYERQELYPGAYDFILKLQRYTEVYILTGVNEAIASYRYEQIKRLLPCIPVDHIILSKKKSRVSCDYFLDDAIHNVIDLRDNGCKYACLFRTPLTRYSGSGILSVSDYDQFIDLVRRTTGNIDTETKMVSIVGPSNSNKVAVAKRLVRDYGFSKVCSNTTDPLKKDTEGYVYVSEERFSQLEKFDLLERTTYKGNHYGISKSHLDGLLETGKPIVAVCDICGALKLKSIYNSVILYASCSEDYLIQKALEEYSASGDITRAIEEIKNLYIERSVKRYCDYEIDTECLENQSLYEEIVSLIK